MFWPVILQLAEMQNGLVTARDIKAITGSYDWAEWAVADGRLERWRRGVYRVRGAPLSPYVDIAAAALAGGAGVGASGLAAGYVWNARDVAPAQPELTAFDGRQVRLKGVRVRRSKFAADDWLTQRHNISVVTAPLMILQIASETSAELGIAIARDLRSRNLVTYPSILECVDATDSKPPSALVTYCERAAEVHGHDDSPAATDLGAALLAADLPPYVAQFQVIVGGRVRLLDFAWPDYMVGIEYLGGANHGPDQLHEDARRRTELTAIGWRILDVTKAMSNDEVIRWVTLALATTRVQ